YLAEASVDARDQARQRAAGRSDALGRQLVALAASLDALHQKLVATGEGGWMAGEEELREKIGKLYGAVNGYEGRPSRSQLDEVKNLGGKLDTAASRLQAIETHELAAVNRLLTGNKLPTLRVPSQEEWEKKPDR
nr:glycosyl hydrolase [Acidobacteriota bacterium]